MSDSRGAGSGAAWHRIRWPFLAVGAVLLVAGSRYEGTQGLEATLLGLGIPLVAAALAFLPLGDSTRAVRIGGGLVALLALVVAEAEIGHLFFPPPPLAQATLSEKVPDADLGGASVGGELELETRGSLDAFKGSAEETFVIDVERAGTHRQIEGTFSRTGSTRVSRRRAPTQTSPHVVDDDRQTLSLPGAGPIHAHLVRLTGTGPRVLELSVRPTLPGGRALEWALALAIALAVLVQATAARVGARTQFAAWVGIAGVLALYLPHHFSRSDPLGALVGALFVAGLVGGAGGFLCGGLATRVFGRAAS